MSSAVEKIISSQTMAAEAEATELAFTTLSQHIGADRKDLVLIHLARFNWPNSALGCPKPGMQYTQAIVPGYLALLKHGDQQYRVHLGNGRGLVCNLTRMPLKLDEVILDNLKEMATQDLADKLGAKIQDITVVEDQFMVWPDTNFGCATGSDSGVSKSIRGHLIKLEYRGKTFEYRTSRSRVQSCPPIETE
jgi:hypothetical protein